MKEVWFLHGANATPYSFNYIKEHLLKDESLKEYTFIDISYDCQENLASIIKILCSSASKDRSLYLIGHSLGGVIAAAMSQRIKYFEMPIDVRGVLSISSPFGGSESADYLRWLYPNYHLFKNISTQNKVITDLKAVGAVIPTTSLVTTSGNNPLYPIANDGIVTVNSQRSLRGANYIELPFSHFEVLVAPETVNYIKVFLKNH